MSTAQETLKIVEDQCAVASNNLSAEVVLETPLEGAAAIDLLKSAEARNRAIAFASSKGINRPGINESPDVYPVTFDGTPVDVAQQKAAADGKPVNSPNLQTAGFRAKIRVVGNPV